MSSMHLSAAGSEARRARMAEWEDPCHTAFSPAGTVTVAVRTAGRPTGRRCRRGTHPYCPLLQRTEMLWGAGGAGAAAGAERHGVRTLCRAAAPGAAFAGDCPRPISEALRQPDWVITDARRMSHTPCRTPAQPCWWKISGLSSTTTSYLMLCYALDVGSFTHPGTCCRGRSGRLRCAAERKATASPPSPPQVRHAVLP